MEMEVEPMATRNKALCLIPRSKKNILVHPDTNSVLFLVLGHSPWKNLIYMFKHSIVMELMSVSL
jgi:hypothetical protein